ncbi:hypothetical protein [Megasphaera sp.]|uniref:hypothetical protein n=1 Tax=Megasphaera sp. TaxID=2023260 RepID=UPI0030785FA8
MDELDEFMEQEACDTMDTVTVFDLPCGPLMRSRKLDAQEDTEEKTPYSHEWTEADKRRFKRANRARKKENERLLKLTEALTDEEVINRFAERNRGLQTHFAYFSTIADTAIRNKWVIGYATYRKRMKKEDIHKEHRSLKNWLHKNGKDTMTAISIGWGKKGYAYVFFVSTSADGVAVGDIGTAFYQNRRKKGYTPVECRPFEKNPYSFLESHYCTPLRCDMELTPLKSRECACMIRSSFALHGKNKTLRTQEAIDNVYSYMHLVDMYDVCRDYGKLNILIQTGSLFVDWREDEEQEEDTDGF